VECLTITPYTGGMFEHHCLFLCFVDIGGMFDHHCLFVCFVDTDGMFDHHCLFVCFVDNIPPVSTKQANKQ
jgi:hypothetical protein